MGPRREEGGQGRIAAAAAATIGPRRFSAEPWPRPPGARGGPGAGAKRKGKPEHSQGDRRKPAAQRRRATAQAQGRRWPKARRRATAAADRRGGAAATPTGGDGAPDRRAGRRPDKARPKVPGGRLYRRRAARPQPGTSRRRRSRAAPSAGPGPPLPGIPLTFRAPSRNSRTG